MVIIKYKSRDNSRKVAQKSHLKSKSTSAGKHCCQGDIYARSTPLTDIKANSAGKESVAWCSWHSCWCKERGRAWPRQLIAFSSPCNYTTCVHWELLQSEKQLTADAPTLPKVAYPSGFWTSLPQEKMLLMEQPPSLLWRQPAEKSSSQNDQEELQMLRKYSFGFAWWFGATS